MSISLHLSSIRHWGKHFILSICSSSLESSSSLGSKYYITLFLVLPIYFKISLTLSSFLFYFNRKIAAAVEYLKDLLPLAAAAGGQVLKQKTS